LYFRHWADKDFLYNDFLVKDEHKSNWIMTASINGHGESKLSNGLISGHCYTLIGAQKIKIKADGSFKNLVKIR